MLQRGWIVRWNGVFPCGSYPDLNIAWQCLVDQLDDNIGEEVLANGGYNGRGRYLIMPSG